MLCFSWDHLSHTCLGGVIKRETLTHSVRSYQLHITRLNVKKNEDYARWWKTQDNLELSEGDLGGDSIRCSREKCARVVTTTLAHIGSTMVHSAMRQ